MEISVALTTFNGAKFLWDQLNSYLQQERLPDELVVSDDGSTDDTISIVQEFASQAPFPVRIAGMERVGIMANFGRAIEACKGKIILLSDHDDVWLPNKIAAGIEPLKGRSGATFSDAQLVDQDLRPLGRTIWQQAGITRKELAAIQRGKALSILMRRPIISGATMAFTADLKEAILPMPEWGVQDEWIAAVIAAVSELTAVREPLILYRQHSTNIVGAGQAPVERVAIRNLYPGTYDHQVLQKQELLNRLTEQGAAESSVLETIRGKVRHSEFRRDLPSSKLRRLFPVLREVVLGRYRRYAVGWRSAGYDLLLRQIDER